ncbi:uncharacterized protein LOC113649016 [Tachysurus fulvidraco]|uniref:uncharacterized protein LOC113649016 n=1 Tax=Tachysurus fulvidraco TaxID=1234273 RepID=UPI001FED88B5|nr:uncharacterized protein LOC113649016 [Tachysurus fulvidraco]
MVVRTRSTWLKQSARPIAGLGFEKFWPIRPLDCYGLTSASWLGGLSPRRTPIRVPGSAEPGDEVLSLVFGLCLLKRMEFCSDQTLPNIDLDQSGHAGFSCEPSSRISTNLIPQVHSTVVDVSFCRTKPVMVEAEVHHLPTEDLIHLLDAPDRTPVLGDKIVDIQVDSEIQSCDFVLSNVAVPISQTILPCTPNFYSMKEAGSGSGKEAVMKDKIKDSVPLTQVLSEASSLTLSSPRAFWVTSASIRHSSE